MTSLSKKSRFENKRTRIPVNGAINGVNLEYTLQGGELFWPGTLEVFVDGVGQTPGFDFEEIGETGFKFLIDPNDDFGNKMKEPLNDTEILRISYWKKPKCKS